MKELLEDNPIKRLLLEKKRKESEQISNSAVPEVNEPKQTFQSKTEFANGDRVFHSKFGVGKVVEIKEIGSSSMIIVDFGNQGTKALDSTFAQLKKF